MLTKDATIKKQTRQVHLLLRRFSCPSDAMHWMIGQNIKSRKRPSVRPSVHSASVDNVASLYHTEEKIFKQFDPK